MGFIRIFFMNHANLLQITLIGEVKVRVGQRLRGRILPSHALFSRILLIFRVFLTKI